MRRLALLLGCLLVLVGAAAAINGVVDPRDEFYSGAALTAALDSNCLLADDVVRARSYPEFKRDLFRRRRRTAVLLSSDVGSARGVNLGFPGFGPEALLDTMRSLEHATPQRQELEVYVQTSFAWFDPRARPRSDRRSLLSEAGYLFDPRTLRSSIDLIRRSRKLAFGGWEQERTGRSCVIHRGSPSPAWRADGTLTGAPQAAAPARRHGFAWSRLTALDNALSIAQTRGWRVVGLSEPAPRWQTYERELTALFAKHGYRWRARRMHA